MSKRTNLKQLEPAPCLRPKDAAKFLQIGLTTLWTWAKAGRIPQPIKIGPRATVWRRADLEKFLGITGEA